MNEMKYAPIAYAKHKIILDKSGKPIDYIFLDVNPLFESLIGLSAQEVIGKKVSDVIPRLIRSKFDWVGTYGQVALTGNSIEFEQYSEPINKWFKVFAVSNEAYHFETFFADITKEKENELLLDSFFSMSLDLLCITDLNGYFLKVNQSWSEILGYPTDAILNKKFLEFVHEDDIPATLKALEKLSLGEEIINFSNRYRCLDGSYKIIEWRSRPNNGKVYAVARDITDHINAKDQLRQSEELLWKVMNSIPLRIFWKDRDLNYLGCNENFLKDSGQTDYKNLIGKNDFDMAWSQYAPLYREDDANVIQTGKSKINYEEKVLDSLGDLKWVSTTKIPLTSSNGEITGVLGIFEDVTERKMIEEKIKQINERYEKLAKTSRSIAFELDITGLFTYVNPVVYDLLGYTESELIGHKYFYELAQGEDQIVLKNYGLDILLHEKSVVNFEHKLTGKDGNIVWVTTNGSPIYDKKGKYIGFRGIDIDISHLKANEEQILNLSYRDQLTGLYNRRFFEEELSRLNTSRNYPLSVLMVDVNGLKLMNDAFGHAAGDELLTTLSSQLKESFRADDIISRIGGDEFVILLPQTTDRAAKELKKRLLKKLEQVTVNHLPLSISCGWATHSASERTIEDTLKHAETVMYRDKTSNRTEHRNSAIKMIINQLFNSISDERHHSTLVSQYAVAIGKALGLSQDELNILQISGRLHDIGKISIPKDILEKPSSLTDAEMIEVKRHPEISYIILSSSSDFISFSEDVLYHHERYDGRGYPKKLSGESIPLFSRIIGLADAFVAMTSDRPYRKKLSVDSAIAILKKESGKQFDPLLVDLFIEQKLFLDKE